MERNGLNSRAKRKKRLARLCTPCKLSGIIKIGNEVDIGRLGPFWAGFRIWLLFPVCYLCRLSIRVGSCEGHVADQTAIFIFILSRPFESIYFLSDSSSRP